MGLFDGLGPWLGLDLLQLAKAVAYDIPARAATLVTSIL